MIKQTEFLEKLEDCPIIAAVKDDEGLECCLESDNSIVFILYGDVCSIPKITGKVKAAGKLAMVHIDLVTGLNGKEVAVDFIHQQTEADGILTTKPALAKRAGELGMYSVLRFFVIDSMAYDNIKKQVQLVRPDVIELMPGVISPKIISRICGLVSVPVIAGGLIADKEDIMTALGAGAVSVSTTNQGVWFL